MRTLRLLWMPALALALPAMAPIGGCAGKAAAVSDDKACTAGNFVLCRCSDQREGTKQCSGDGMSFGACQPCPAESLPPGGDAGALPDDAGFTPVDASSVDAGFGPALDSACNGKIAVLASNASSDFTYSGVFVSGRSFSVSSSSGVPMLTPASIVAIDGKLVAAYRTRLDWVVSTTLTKFWSPPARIGSAASQLGPAVVSWGGKLKAIFLGTDGRYHAANYDPTSAAWDNAVENLGAADAGPGPGTSAPGVAGVGSPGVPGSAIVVGFSGADGSLYRQSWYGSSWGGAIKSGAALGSDVGPLIVSLDGGTYDLLSVFVGADKLMHAVTRGAQGTSFAWGVPGTVDGSAAPLDQPAVAPMRGGRALLVYRDATSKPFYSVFDGSKSPPWSAPSELIVGANPTVASTPSVIQGQCGEDASVAYAEKNGNVAILRFAAGAWTGPYVVGGMTRMTFASIGELP